MAAQKFYSPSDIMAVLSVSRTEANRIMHEFENRGQLFRKGRLLRVRVSDFDAWTEEVTRHNNSLVKKQRDRLLKILAT